MSFTNLPLRPIDYNEEEPDDDLEQLELLHSNNNDTIINSNNHLSFLKNSNENVYQNPNSSNDYQSYQDDDGNHVQTFRSSQGSYVDYQSTDSPNDKINHQLEKDKDQSSSNQNVSKTHPNLKHQPPRHTKRVLFFGGAALIGLAYLIMFTATKGTRYDHSVKMNVILMISDGFGPASETFGRSFVEYINSLPPEKQENFKRRWKFDLDPNLPRSSAKKTSEDSKSSDGQSKNVFGSLPLDPLLIGSSRTRSSNSLITDSAAGATAFSCALKTYNGGIAVEPTEQKPCGTVLEAAKHRGYLTGLVATSRITHATPASFYAHVIDRDMEPRIAKFLIGDGPLGRSVDLAFGGGRKFFSNRSISTTKKIKKMKRGERLKASNLRRDDGGEEEDLIEIAKKFKFNVISSNEEFEEYWDQGKGKGLNDGGSKKFKTPVIGLFNDDHMMYEIDRMNVANESLKEPSLRNMSLAALQTLSREAKSSSAHGFFLMIEGSRIDMAAHSNDPVGHLYDILAYQETARTVKTWVDEANKAGWPTLMISVSDHETGGLSLGRQLDPKVYPRYGWYPEVLLNSTSSVESLTRQIRLEKIRNPNRFSSSSSSASKQDLELGKKFLIDQVFQVGLGIHDSDEVELEKVLGLIENLKIDSKVDDESFLFLSYFLADMVSRRAQIGWSTHGHSGIDVNLYGYPFELVKDLMGNRENVEIGKFIVDVMSIDLDVVTKDLNRLVKVWHKTEDDLDKVKEKYTKLNHYSHEF